MDTLRKKRNFSNFFFKLQLNCFNRLIIVIVLDHCFGRNNFVLFKEKM